MLQRWLTRVGFRTAIDGHFGSATRRSLRAYERSSGLHADGVLSRRDAKGLRVRAYAATPPRERTQARAVPRTATDSPGGPQAELSPDGRTAVAPQGAPEPVKAAIAAANRLVDKPYVYGGGHGSFEDDGYDCSGAASYALHGAGVLDAPMDSSGLAGFGASGVGRWITVYANSGHAYLVIAGLRFDTSGSGEKGPRWRSKDRSGEGYTVRHPAGL